MSSKVFSAAFSRYVDGKNYSSSLLFPLLRNSKPRRNTTAKGKRCCHVFTIWEHKGRYVFPSLFVAATFLSLFVCGSPLFVFSKNFSSLPENCLVFFSLSCLFFAGIVMCPQVRNWIPSRKKTKRRINDKIPFVSGNLTSRNTPLPKRIFFFVSHAITPFPQEKKKKESF